MQDIESLMREHIDNDRERFVEIADTLKDMKENHLAHIQESIIKLETNYDWIKWGVLAVVGGMIAVYFKK